MKKFVLLLVLLIAVLSPAAAAKGDISAGIAFGEPTAGITGSYSLDDNLSIDGLFSFSVINDHMFIRLNASYEVVEVAIENMKFYPFIGVGVQTRFFTVFGLDLVAPMGISYYFNDIPLEIYLEFTPGFDVANSFDPSVGGVIGARYQLNF